MLTSLNVSITHAIYEKDCKKFDVDIIAKGSKLENQWEWDGVYGEEKGEQKEGYPMSRVRAMVFPFGVSYWFSSLYI